MFKTNRNSNEDDDNHPTNGTEVTSISNTPRQTSKNGNNIMNSTLLNDQQQSHIVTGGGGLNRPSSNARMEAFMNTRNCFIGGANIMPTLPANNLFPCLTPPNNYGLFPDTSSALNPTRFEYVRSANRLDFNLRPRVSRDGKFIIDVTESKKALTEDLRLEALCLVIDFGYRNATKSNRDILAKAVMAHLCYDRGFPASIGASSVYKWFQAYENSVRGHIVRPLQTKFENRGRKKLVDEIEKQNPGYLAELWQIARKCLPGMEENFDLMAKTMNDFSHHDKRGPVKLSEYHVKTWFRHNFGMGTSRTGILRNDLDYNENIDVDTELSADEEKEDDWNEDEENPTKKKKI